MRGRACGSDSTYRQPIHVMHPVAYDLALRLAKISMVRKMTRFCPDRRSPRIRHVETKRMHHVMDFERGSIAFYRSSYQGS